MCDDLEPYGVAGERALSGVDYAAIGLAFVVTACTACVPPLRLVVLTGVRLGIAGLLWVGGMMMPGVAATIMTWSAHAFMFLALFSVAAHVEAATLGPLVDRIVGMDRT